MTTEEDLSSESSLETPFSIYALDDMKYRYRLWFTGFVWFVAGEGATPIWETIFSEASVFWLWEDEDEECLKKIAWDLPIPYVIPFGDSNKARRAFEAGRTTVAANPLAHLTPRTRLRFVAWLMVVGPIRKDRILDDEVPPLTDMLIYDWAKSTTLLSDSKAAETCDICSVSHLLPAWIETLSQVYSLEDLKSLPWGLCDCLKSQLSAYPGHPVVELEKHSLVLHILYELVVPLWILVHWVTFRTTQLESDAFFDMIHRLPLDHRLFAWDAADELELCQQLMYSEDMTLYPRDWNGYMVEIPLNTWQEIRNITGTAVRPLTGFDDDSDLRTRLAAVFLKYSCTALAFQKILAAFDINFEHSRFDFVTCVDQSTHTNLGSPQFWTTSNLEKWLMTRRETC
ncbi:hypothetical protein C8R45DRAFT_1020148 [Mycena sanguinolenta]|nr:hypothetical protein C8R45DRAFT_1020148 [Mycena sanguinolenta]